MHFGINFLDLYAFPSYTLLQPQTLEDVLSLFNSKTKV